MKTEKSSTTDKELETFTPKFEFSVCMVGGAIDVKDGEDYIGYQNELSVLKPELKGWKLKKGDHITDDFIWMRQKKNQQ